MDFVFWLIALHALSCVLYLLTLSALAFGFRPNTADTQAMPAMAVIIPAHNEGSGIGRTVRAAFLCQYPKDRFKVWVVADNCTDDTAARAREAGAEVVERVAPSDPGKGQALDWLLRERPEILDWAQHVAFLDADTLPDRLFFMEAAASLARTGNWAVQGFYGVLNPKDSWRTGLMASALALSHHLRPAGRERLGGTAGLKGNGMAFQAELLRRTGWPAKGVVEDLEFSLDLLLQGVNVLYNPKAVVLAEMASTAAQATSQRARWEGGRLSVATRYVPRLLGASTVPLAARLDAAMDLATPPLALLGLELFALWAASAWLTSGPPLLFLGALCALAVIVCCALLQRKEPVSVWLRLAGAPAFVLWKLWIYLTMAISKPQGWTRTKRAAELHGNTTQENKS